ncbi:hypothetical protein M569_03432 [Genlisea aurea]|uniref:CSN8/PSMD8/EIF3K domain-containing protein n=1 Tax=Genlisea aurea TaxID=192259 RepID=S8D1X7_9LAMI|nr:hypothetical protein M569_03432 [Genlisea aurea]
MDFSDLNEALASESYDQIGEICDNLMLQAASEGVPFQDEWPYAVHLLGHIYVNDINSARFLWKKIPSGLKSSQPEISAAWKICQKLWTKDYGGVHESLREFDWSSQSQGIIIAFSERYRKRMFELLVSAYSTISIRDATVFLGMNEDDAINYAAVGGWTVEPNSGMLTVKKAAVAVEQKVDPGKLQRLTEYVFHLEH